MGGAAIEVLSTVPYFAGLDAATLASIAGAAVQRRHAADEVVFVEGESCTGLYVLQEGWLKSVKISAAGREQIVRFMGPGDTFNEITVLADSTNLVTVVALEPSTVWVIPRQVLLRLLEENLHLARVVTQSLARRVLYLTSLVEDLSLRTVEARLARFLLEQRHAGTLHRPRWATQAEMAARIGTVPDVLNRVLRKLAEEGLIRVERHQIEILDRPALEGKAMLEG